MRVARLIEMSSWGSRLQWRRLPSGCCGLDEASDGVVRDSGGGARVPGQRVQRGWAARRSGREGWKTRAEDVIVEEGGELWVWLDGTFVLEIADLEVEAFDLAVQLERWY